LHSVLLKHPVYFRGPARHTARTIGQNQPQSTPRKAGSNDDDNPIYLK